MWEQRELNSQQLPMTIPGSLASHRVLAQHRNALYPRLFVFAADGRRNPCSPPHFPCAGWCPLDAICMGSTAAVRCILPPGDLFLCHLVGRRQKLDDPILLWSAVCFFLVGVLVLAKTIRISIFPARRLPHNVPNFSCFRAWRGGTCRASTHLFCLLSPTSAFFRHGVSRRDSFLV